MYSSRLDDLDDVVIGVWTWTRKSTSKRARDSYLAIVQAGSSRSETIDVRTAGGSTLNLMLRAGDVCILDLDSTVMQSSACDWMIAYQIPRRSLRTFAAHRGMPELDSLHCHTVLSDPILHHMSRAVRMMLQERPAGETFGDSFVRSFYSHILDSHGRQGFARSAAGRNLTERHIKLIDEALLGSLGREVRVGLLASRCAMSPGHFARAFRNTYGIPFHQHLIRVRIRRAKELLRTSGLSLPMIAEQVGYSNQATFTESFSRTAGISPGRYRRSSPDVSSPS